MSLCVILTDVHPVWSDWGACDVNWSGTLEINPHTFETAEDPKLL